MGGRLTRLTPAPGPPQRHLPGPGWDVCTEGTRARPPLPPEAGHGPNPSAVLDLGSSTSRRCQGDTHLVEAMLRTANFALSLGCGYSAPGLSDAQAATPPGGSTTRTLRSLLDHLPGPATVGVLSPVRPAGHMGRSQVSRTRCILTCDVFSSGRAYRDVTPSQFEEHVH